IKQSAARHERRVHEVVSMPVYEYRCDACATTFEKFHRTVASADTVTCNSCGAAVRRLMSTFVAPRGAAPGPDSDEHPAPPGGDDHTGFGGHGHSHGPGGHSHADLHGHSH